MQPNHLKRNLRGTFRIALLILVSFSACSRGRRGPAVEPSPTTTVLTVRIAAELQPLRPRLAACAGELPATGLVVHEAAAPELPSGPLEITLWLGEPPAGAAHVFSLGREEMIFITSAGSGLEGLSEEEVRKLYAPGTGASQEQPAAVEVWVPQDGTAGRKMLDRWANSPAYPAEAFLAPSAGAGLEAVVQGPSALALVPAAWIEGEVERVFVLGELPALALSRGIPEGAVRELIGCLQDNGVYGDG